MSDCRAFLTVDGKELMAGGASFPGIPSPVVRPEEREAAMASAEQVKQLNTLVRRLQSRKKWAMTTVVDSLVNEAKYGLRPPMVVMPDGTVLYGLPALVALADVETDGLTPENAMIALKAGLRTLLRNVFKEPLPQRIKDWNPNSPEPSAYDPVGNLMLNCLWIFQAEYNSVKASIQALQADLASIGSSAHRARLDEIAKEKGYEDWAQMKAVKDVELEWYCTLYPMSGCGPGEGFPQRAVVEAYKRMERQQFGDTSYAMVSRGETPQTINMRNHPRALELLDSLTEELEIQIQARIDEAEAKADAAPQADLDQGKKDMRNLLIAGGVGLGLILLAKRFG
jgi:hypothetical protein